MNRSEYELKVIAATEEFRRKSNLKMIKHLILTFGMFGGYTALALSQDFPLWSCLAGLVVINIILKKIFRYDDENYMDALHARIEQLKKEKPSENH